MDAGNCGYQTIPSSSFPYRYIAAPNEAFYAKDAVCGACYEVNCTGPYDTTQANPCSKKTVIIKVTDNCPTATNTQWCSGDMVHFDLSQEAFTVISPNLGIGVISTQYRRVACPYTTPSKVVQASGVSVWWIKFWLWDVAGWGSVKLVELQYANSATWYAMAQPDADGGWVLNAPNGAFALPLSLRLTNTAPTPAQLVLSKVITTIAAGTQSSVSGTANFPASAAETTQPNKSFLNFGVYILVAIVVIVILIVAIFLVLRSRSRARGSTISEYVRASVSPQKQEEFTLKDLPVQAVSSQSELTEAPTSPTSATESELVQLQPTPAPIPASSEWEQRTDTESGQPYFYNSATGVTQWETPDGFQA